MLRGAWLRCGGPRGWGQWCGQLRAEWSPSERRVGWSVDNCQFQGFNRGYLVGDHVTSWTW